jgi:hypothetical protein
MAMASDVVFRAGCEPTTEGRGWDDSVDPDMFFFMAMFIMGG